MYREAVQTLLDKGLAYEAFDTPEELDALRKAAEPDVFQYDATTRESPATAESGCRRGGTSEGRGRAVCGSFQNP